MTPTMRISLFSNRKSSRTSEDLAMCLTEAWPLSWLSATTNCNRQIEDAYHYDGQASFAKRQKMTTPSPSRKDTSRSVRGRPRVKIDRSTFGKIKPLLTEDEVALTTPSYGEDQLESFKKADSEAKPVPEGLERPGKPVKKAIRMGYAEVKIVNEKRYHEGGRLIEPYKSKKRNGAQPGPKLE